MTDQPANVNIRLALEAAAARNSQETVSVLRKRFEELQKAAGSSGTVADEALKRLSKSSQQAEKDTAKLRGEYSKLAEEVKKVKSASSGLSLDKAEGLLGRAGASLTGIGAGGIGQAVSGGADVLQLIMSAQEGLKGLSGTVSATGAAGVAATGGMAGLTASLGPLLAVALPIGAAILAVSEGVKVWQKSLDLATGNLARFTENIDQFIKITSGTSDNAVKSLSDNQARITELNKQRDAIQREMDKAVAQNFFAPLSSNYQNAKTKVKELNDEISRLQQLSNDAFGAVQDGSTKAADAQAEQAKAAEELTKKTLTAAEANKQAAIEQEQLKTLTLDAAKSRLDALKSEQSGLEAAIKTVKDSGDTSKDAAEKLKEYETQLKNNTAAQQALNNILAQGGHTIDKAVLDAAEKDRVKAEKEAQDLDARNVRVAAVQQKYNDDVEHITEQSLQRKADIEQSYADKLIDIARNAADAAENSLRKLGEQQADLFTSLGRDEEKAQRDAGYKVLDIQIATQREQAKAYRDHQREIEQIQKDAQAREVGFLFKRDFLGLYQSRLQTSRSIEGSNAKFGSDQQERQSAQREQLQDLQQAQARERQERLIAYQQQLADARTAYQRELADAQRKQIEELQIAQRGRTADLQALQQKTAAELRARQSAYDKELQMAALYGQRRIMVEKQIQDALLAQANARLSSLGAVTNMRVGSSGEVANRRAGGGYLNAGDVTWVNERPGQRESFNGAPFPPGKGLFMATQSGTVDAGSGNTQYNTFNIKGDNPQTIAQEVVRVLDRVMK